MEAIVLFRNNVSFLLAVKFRHVKMYVYVMVRRFKAAEATADSGSKGQVSKRHTAHKRSECEYHLVVVLCEAEKLLSFSREQRRSA